MKLVVKLNNPILIATACLLLMACKTQSNKVTVPVKNLGAKGLDRPNVVFLFTDDQRAGTYNLEGKGNPDVLTPVFDKLAEEGTLFPNTYVFGGDRTSVCMPSRAQLLSGKNLFKYEDIDTPSKGPEDFNLPVAFRLAGYQTLRTGKGNNIPYGITPEFETNIEHANRGTVPGNIDYFNDAMTFIKNRDKGRPFFTYLAIGAPHVPYPAEDKDLALYNAEAITPPVDALVPHPVLTQFNEKVTELKTMADVKRDLMEYYASITFADRKMGELVKLLKDEGVYDNTIIIVAGDNGLSIGSHGLDGKSNLLEFGGMHVSMIITGPQIKHQQSNALIYLLDIFPTLADLCDLPIPKTLDGKDLTPILTGKEKTVRNALLTVYTDDEQRAVRTKEWKLLSFPDQDIFELYHLSKDPRELKNLVGNPAYAEKLNEMKTLLIKEQQAAGDCYPCKVHINRKYNSKKPFDGKVDLEAIRPKINK